MLPVAALNSASRIWPSSGSCCTAPAVRFHWTLPRSVPRLTYTTALAGTNAAALSGAGGGVPPANALASPTPIAAATTTDATILLIRYLRLAFVTRVLPPASGVPAAP